MKKVNIHDAKTHLSSLLAAMEERGEHVVLCRNGKPIAEIRPLGRKKDPLKIHRELGPIKFKEDPTAPLRPEDWPEAHR